MSPTPRCDAAILLVLFDTGVRLGELIGLRLDDVNRRARLAHVTGKGGHTRAVRFGTKTAVAVDPAVRIETMNGPSRSSAIGMSERVRGWIVALMTTNEPDPQRYQDRWCRPATP